MAALPHEKIAHALELPKPQEELMALARQLKLEGMSQEEMTTLYTDFLVKHRDDADETKYDALYETLTLIAGECAPAWRIFPR